MRSDKIVIRDKERRENDGAIKRVKAVSGADMEFISSVESFDDLFVGSEFFGNGVEVL